MNSPTPEAIQTPHSPPREVAVLDVSLDREKGMRVPKQVRELDIVISSDPGETQRVQQEIESALSAHQFHERDIFSIKLALEEALINAIKHGNQMDRDKKVHISCRVNYERFEVRIMDEGTGFDPTDLPDPLDVENLEKPSGRGLLLMRHYMTEVTFHPPGNLITMSKVRNGED